MKILAIADVECKALWDYYSPGKLADYDLIISCGDLDPEYLMFLVTMARCPLIYVHGNHDGKYGQKPPEGCICIDDDIFEYKGVRFLGLGGSTRYNESGSHQYTELQMKWRIAKLYFKIRKHRGFDVLVTHAAARGLGDMDDRPHMGFSVFNELLDKYMPRVHLHGHTHLNYGMKTRRIIEYHDTRIINSYERFDVEL